MIEFTNTSSQNSAVQSSVKTDLVAYKWAIPSNVLKFRFASHRPNVRITCSNYQRLINFVKLRIMLLSYKLQQL